MDFLCFPAQSLHKNNIRKAKTERVQGLMKRLVRINFESK